jgi:hypothetical protein
MAARPVRKPSRKGACNGWTPERRARQSALLRRTRPWLRSTGPRTAAGKARSAQNALKHGHCTAAANAEISAIRTALQAQRAYLRAVEACLRARKPLPPALRARGTEIYYNLLRVLAMPRAREKSGETNYCGTKKSAQHQAPVLQNQHENRHRHPGPLRVNAFPRQAAGPDRRAQHAVPRG